MNPENFYASKMSSKTIDELKNYIDNQDHFHEDAVLAAILEIEKRDLQIEGTNKIKEELTALKAVETIEEIGVPKYTDSTSTKVPELYSAQFIYIFGALFSVFGGGVLMALNFMALKNKKAAKITIISSIVYSILLTIIIDAFGAVNILVSLGTSILGIYLLHQYIWKKENPNEINYKEKNIWKPLLIGFLIAMPLAYLMLISGNLPQ